MTASMPTENFRNFITGSLSPSSYQNFGNFSTGKKGFPVLKFPKFWCHEKGTPEAFNRNRAKVRGSRGQGRAQKNGGDQNDTVLLENMSDIDPTTRKDIFLTQIKTRNLTSQKPNPIKKH